MAKKKKKKIYRTPKGLGDLRLLKSRLILALKNYMDYDDEDEYADRILLDVYKQYKKQYESVVTDIKWAFKYLLKDSPNKEVRTKERVTRAKKKANELARKVWKK